MRLRCPSGSRQCIRRTGWLRREWRRDWQGHRRAGRRNGRRSWNGTRSWRLDTGTRERRTRSWSHRLPDRRSKGPSHRLRKRHGWLKCGWSLRCVCRRGLFRRPAFANFDRLFSKGDGIGRCRRWRLGWLRRFRSWRRTFPGVLALEIPGLRGFPFAAGKERCDGEREKKIVFHDAMRTEWTPAPTETPAAYSLSPRPALPD
jgi:hypothetical protein